MKLILFSFRNSTLHRLRLNSSRTFYIKQAILGEEFGLLPLVFSLSTCRKHACGERMTASRTKSGWFVRSPESSDCYFYFLKEIQELSGSWVAQAWLVGASAARCVGVTNLFASK